LCCRFALDDLLVPRLQQRLQSGGKFRRSFLSFSIYLTNICLLCDPKVYAQWCQGVVTCYMLSAWLLGAEQVPLSDLQNGKWQQQGPPVLCSNKAMVMQMSVAGAV
jgi:hypothetical protein